MITAVEEIVDEIDYNINHIQLNFEDDTWRKDIPSEPGWYLIKTNAPLDKLRKCHKSPENKAHTDIPETIKKTAELQKAGIAITQSGNADYVVYNGEADNLKARAREHVQGHRKTYCLGLSNYPNIVGSKWIFCYMPMSNCKTVQNREDKLLRIAVEQAWRAKNGWPILCRK
jgi:hypothetical protein